MPSQVKKPYSHGFTLVEIMTVIIISSLLVGVIISFMISVTGQFAVSTVRGQMNTQVTSATNRLQSDIQYSRFVLAENSVSDSAAPTDNNRWNSNDTQLVLGVTARNSSDEPLGDTYIDQLDNYVYYLKDDTLYRRLLAHPNSNNRHTTATCAQTTTGGCPSDAAILRGIESLQFVYYDNDGAETTSYDTATSIKINITIKTKQSRHEIAVNSVNTFRLASYFNSSNSTPGLDSGPGSVAGIPSLQGSINAGYGGVEVGYSSSFDINGDISTLGNFVVNSGSHVKVNNIYAAHMNCGPTSSLKYGTLCPPSPAPIRTGSGSSISLTANTACGPANPVAEKASSAAVLSITNTTTSCDLPSELPVFDKQAMVGSIPAENTTTGTLNCFGNSGRVFEFPGNHRITGNLDFSGGTCSGRITSGGVLYIEGSLNIGWGSYLEVDPSVTEPVTVVVNGRVVVYNGRLGTSGLPKLNLITFHSVNNACSSSPTCNSLSMKDLYDSGRSVNHSMLIHHTYTNVYANLYAPFSSIRLATSPKVEVSEIYGQRVDLGFGHLGEFTLAP